MKNKIAFLAILSLCWIGILNAQNNKQPKLILLIKQKKQ